MAAQMQRLPSSFENILGRGPVEPEGNVEAGKAEEDDIKACLSAVYIEDAKGPSQKCCEKVVLTVGVILAVAQGFSAPAIAVFMGESITTLAVADHAKEIEAMTPEFIKIAGLAAVQFFLAFGWQSCLAWAAAKQALRWHRSFVEVLLALDVSWYDEHDPAGVASKLESDSSNVYLFMSSALGFLISNLAQFVAGLLLALYEGWQLAFVVCAAMPILMCAGHHMGKGIEHYTEVQQINFARASAVAEEALMAIRSVAAFGGEAREVARFEKELIPAKVGGIRAVTKIGAAWGVLNVFYPCLYSLALWFGGHVLMSEENAGFEPARIITVMLSLMVGVSALNEFSGFVPVMARAAVSAKSMKQVICREVGGAIAVAGRPLQDQELPANLTEVDIIEFRKVSFRYPAKLDKWILHSFSFRAEKGQKVALVGESGCGKSTTIQLLERFYDPSAGEVLVNGTPLCRVPTKAWRRLVGYVGQEPVLFATSIMRNLKALDNSVSDEQAIQAAKVAQIYDTVMQLPAGMDTHVGPGGGLLSGGQRQRIAIARALAKNPQVLLLDEATSALDNESERMVQAALDSANAAMGRNITTISVAHRLSTIKDSDTIYVLKDGYCLEQGNHEQLMASKGQYHNMVKLQQASSEEAKHQQEEQSDEDRSIEEDEKDKLVTVASFASSLGLGLEVQKTIYADAAEDVGSPAVCCRLLRLMGRYWWIWPVSVVMILAGAASMPLEAVFFNAAVVSLSEAALGDFEAMYEKLDTAVLGLSIVGLCSGIAVFAQSYLFAYKQESLCMILRKAAFARTVCMDMSFFDAPENQTGSILVSLQMHMNRVGQMLGMQLGNSAAALFTCILSIGFSFFGCWELSLLLFGLMPLCGLLALTVAACVARADPERMEAYGKAGKATSEAVTSIRTVKAMGAEEHIMEVIDESLNRLTELNKAKSWRLGLSLGLNLALVQLIFLAGFSMSAVCIQNWGFDAGQVLMSLFCVVFGVKSITSIVQHIPDAASGRIAAMEVFRLVDQVSKIDATQPTGRIEDFGDGSIEFKDVRFWYPHRAEVRVLKNISFTITKGQSVAFVGSSGSGKSTIIQLLQRFYDPQSGSIRIGGTELKELNVAWWRRQVGMVSQDPVLFDLSLEENVKYGYPEATAAELLKAAEAAHMDYVLSGAVKWSDRMGLRGEKLSGGQKQRCALARALIRKPEVMLLDEATSALDSVSEQVVQRAMQEARLGRTTITVAHRLSTIRTSDRIFVISNGRLVESGTYDELIDRDGNFAKLAAGSL
ncbi:Abcb1a [Symbiodinium sp. CCMP2456]|nr:Abcb1a [Symbiodinium sp. CCMP2456]